MKPWWWRRGAGLAGLGALMLAPLFSGAGILLALGLPFEHLRFGLAFDYVGTLDMPTVRPFATRIRWGGTLGALLPLAACVAWIRYRRDTWLAFPRPARVRPFLSPRELPDRPRWTRPHQPSLGRGLVRRLRLPPGESLLIVAPDYGPALRHLADAVATATGPLLVLDVDGLLYRDTAGRRAAEGGVVRLAPFGGGVPWNPLAAAWRPEALDDTALQALAQRWFPERRRMDRALVSQVHAVFVALVHAVDDVLRAGGESVPPAPGDLWRLLATGDARLEPAWLHALAEAPGLRATTRDSLRRCAACDAVLLDAVAERLAEPLRAFAGEDIDAGTRGMALRFDASDPRTVYVHVPAGRCDAAAPLLDALLAQWRDAMRHAEGTLAIHALDHWPRPAGLLAHMASPEPLRVFASVRRLAPCLGDTGGAALMGDLFGVVAWHGWRDTDRATREAPALAAHLAHRGRYHAAHYPKAVSVDDLLRPRGGEQLIVAPDLMRPLRCRLPRPVRNVPAPPILEGAPMSLPRPLAALAATLLAACSSPPPTATPPVATAADPCPFWPPDSMAPEATSSFHLGPHRFCVQQRLFHNLIRASQDRVGFALNWPTLEPLPPDLDEDADQDTFVSTLEIRIDYFDKLTDEEARLLPRRWIEPIDPSDPQELRRPEYNLGLRIKGDPVHGLTPYYADLPAIRRFYEGIDGPDTTAGLPDTQEDWFVDMDEHGIPRTVLKCSVAEVPDGVRLANGRLVHDPKIFRRATCMHMFAIPEYKSAARITYQRVIAPDWKRIETRIRAILASGEMR